jgi:hypothetical protein
MPHCSVPGCITSNGHAFPKDTLLRKRWVIAIKREDNDKKGKLWTPGPSARVCSQHFKDDDFKTPPVPGECSYF